MRGVLSTSFQSRRPSSQVSSWNPWTEDWFHCKRERGEESEPLTMLHFPDPQSAGFLF